MLAILLAPKGGKRQGYSAVGGLQGRSLGLRTNSANVWGGGPKFCALFLLPCRHW